MASHFLPNQIFENIPAFDGVTSCSKWIEEWERICAHFKLTDQWKLEHMQRFLTGVAQDWWPFSKNGIINDLTVANAKVKLLEFKNAIKAGFPEADDKKKAEQENLALGFKVWTDDPKAYVFKKLSLCFRIDDRMTDETKLVNLFMGLDPELRWTIKKQLGARGTVNNDVNKGVQV